MSKALEAAHEAGQKAYWSVQFGDKAVSVGEALAAYRDAFLAHLVEDEEVVSQVKQIVAEGLYYGLPQVDPNLVPDGLAGDITREVLCALSGKE